MASLTEILLIVGLIVLVLASLGAAMYITYRIGLRVALNFTKTGRSIQSEDSD